MSWHVTGPTVWVAGTLPPQLARSKISEVDQSNFSLGAKRSAYVNHTATAANKRLHLRIQPNRQPFRLNSETEVSLRENFDSPSQAEREASKNAARPI